MIQAVFTRSEGVFTGFSVRGHAGYANPGEDVVCAAVSSAVQLTCNAVTELLEVPAQLSVGEDVISLRLPAHPPLEACRFIQALYLHLTLVAQDYRENLNVTAR